MGTSGAGAIAGTEGSEVAIARGIGAGDAHRLAAANRGSPTRAKETINYEGFEDHEEAN